MFNSIIHFDFPIENEGFVAFQLQNVAIKSMSFSSNKRKSRITNFNYKKISFILLLIISFIINRDSVKNKDLKLLKRE